MDPRVSWVSYDQGDFSGAYEGFLKAQCGSPEKPTYLLVAGIAATKSTSVDYPSGPFLGILHSYADATNFQTGAPLKPLAFAYAVRLAAEGGLSLDVSGAVVSYGPGYESDQVVWLDETFPRKGDASEDVTSREFLPVGRPAPVKGVGSYYWALALAKSSASADRAEARGLLERELPSFAGDLVEHGVPKDLRREGELLLEALRNTLDGDSGPWGLYLVIGVVFVAELVLVQRLREKRRERAQKASSQETPPLEA